LDVIEFQIGNESQYQPASSHPHPVNLNTELNPTVFTGIAHVRLRHETVPPLPRRSTAPRRPSVPLCSSLAPSSEDYVTQPAAPPCFPRGGSRHLFSSIATSPEGHAAPPTLAGGPVPPLHGSPSPEVCPAPLLSLAEGQRLATPPLPGSLGEKWRPPGALPLLPMGGEKWRPEKKKMLPIPI
jgi:hypothetical protein